MDPVFEQKYHLLETTHWWFRARRDCIHRLLGHLHIAHDAKILDVGCSGGALVAQLRAAHFSHVTGIDISEAAIRHCLDRRLSDVHVMDALSPSFPPQTFDCVIASDILEHLPQPDIALDRWRQLLRPGGTLIVFVPAFPFLWSSHDLVNHHFRRYTRSTLSEQISAAGFDIQRAGYWNASLFPPIATIRLAQRSVAHIVHETAPKDALRGVNPFLNRVLLALLVVENRLLAAGLTAPFGVSAWAIGRAGVSPHP